MRAASLLERFAGVGPVEGVRHCCVVVGDELSDLGLKSGHRSEVSASQTFSLEDAEKDLDLVEPRAVFGKIDEADTVADVREELSSRLHGFEKAANVFFPVDRLCRTARRPIGPGFPKHVCSGCQQ